jgi:hypothetical protein
VEGDVVLHGIWYIKLSPNSCSYLLRDDKSLAYVFSHLILASKFPMPPTSHIVKGRYVSYKLSMEVVDIISNALEVAKLFD